MKNTKNLVILISFLLLIILGSFFEKKYIKETAQYMVTDITYVQNLMNNNKVAEAKENIKEVKKVWNDVEEIWEIFVNHDEIDRIETFLTEYEAYINEERISDATVAYNKLYRAILHIVDKEKIKLKNIL